MSDDTTDIDKNFIWWSQLNPNNQMLLPQKPRFCCPQCKSNDWFFLSLFTFNEQCKTNSIWRASSSCSECYGATEWLLDSDKPFENQTELMHRPIGKHGTQPKISPTPQWEDKLKKLMEKIEEAEEKAEEDGYYKWDDFDLSPDDEE